MLVRFKKRGALPPNCESSRPLAPIREGSSRPNGSAWRGMVIEVEPFGRGWSCGGQVYEVTDSRLVSIVQPGVHACICEHYLIDDLDAYESDSADEQAQVGDIAFAPLVAELAKVKP